MNLRFIIIAAAAIWLIAAYICWGMECGACADYAIKRGHRMHIGETGYLILVALLCVTAGPFLIIFPPGTKVPLETSSKWRPWPLTEKELNKHIMINLLSN